MNRDDKISDDRGQAIATSEAPTDAEYEALVAAEGSIPSRVAMAVATLVALLLVGFWVYAFIRGPGVPHQDELVSIEERERWVDYAAEPIAFRADPNIADAPVDDRTAIEFMVFAEQRCRQMILDIDALPGARTVDTFDQRADLVDAGTNIIETTIDDIEAFPTPTNASDAKISRAWIEDYRVLIDDRRGHANRLRDDDDGPLELSASRVESVRVTRLLTTFSEVNSMYACVPPGDV